MSSFRNNSTVSYEKFTGNFSINFVKNFLLLTCFNVKN